MRKYAILLEAIASVLWGLTWLAFAGVLWYLVLNPEIVKQLKEYWNG